MLYCRRCGEVFSAWGNGRDPGKLNGAYRCPVCGEYYDLVQTKACVACSRDCDPEELTDGGFCPRCRQEVLRRFSQSMAAFTEAERALITESYEGVYL